jgi:voltage-gated potassium channel
MLMAELKYERFRQKQINPWNKHEAGRLLIYSAWSYFIECSLMMETVSEFDLKYHSYLVLLEWIITVLFTIEYIFRIISIIGRGNTSLVSMALLIC